MKLVNMEPTALLSVAVVIPVRNRANVIRRAIESVYAQTYKPSEIVVVDDGSDDFGATVAAARAAEKPEIPMVVISLPKRSGAPHARNIGIETARSDWIALLDTDDSWRADKLDHQIGLIKATTSMVVTDTVFDDGKNQTKTKFSRGVGDAESLFYENSLGGCSAALLRKSAFIEAGGFDQALPSCQDWDMWLKISRTGQIAVSSLPLTYYHFDASERISKNVESILAGHKILHARILDLYAPAWKRRDILRFQRFQLAQTLVYFTGGGPGALLPAIQNLILPHPRTSRRSSLHLLLSVLKII